MIIFIRSVLDVGPGVREFLTIVFDVVHSLCGGLAAGRGKGAVGQWGIGMRGAR